MMRILAILIGATLSALAQPTITCPSGTVQQGQTLVCTASGGTPPYTWSMLTGSVGGVVGSGANNATGTYSAPASVTSPQSFGGCLTPPNWVFNTRIDALPLHPSNATWFGNIDANTLRYTGGENSNNQVLSTDPTTAMTFAFTPNLSMIFPNPVNTSYSEGGMGYHTQQAPGIDNHMLVTYRDTCQQQENYKLFPAGFDQALPLTNSRSGMIQDLKSFLSPGIGTDAAGLPITPLMIHQWEIAAAAAGDVNAIKHAVRVTFDAASIDRNLNIWPAQANNSSAGCQISQPDANCPPYGARLRLKSTVSAPTCSASTAAQNIVNAYTTQLKNYGLILADIGTSWELDIDGSAESTADMAAAKSCMLAINGTSANFEFVDESSLNTNSTNSGTSITWLEAKLDNGTVTPSNAAVLKVTDAAAGVAEKSIVLQGVSVGVQNANETVLCGIPPVQFSPWVTGSSNKNWTAAISPSGGANGTMSSSGVYTPPACSAVSVRTVTTATVTSSADATVSNSFTIVILPMAVDGKLYLSIGKQQTTDYNDGVRTWWSDMKNGQPWLFPSNVYLPRQVNGPYSGTITATSPSIFTTGVALLSNGVGDMHFPLWVGTGTASATVYLSNLVSATGHAGFSIDVNGSTCQPATDLFTATGAQKGTAAYSCTASGPLFHMIVRSESPQITSGAGFTIQVPCCTSNAFYTFGGSDIGVAVNGLVVALIPQSPGSVSSTSAIGSASDVVK